MREAVFIKKNTPRWQQFEELLASRSRNNPDQLAGLFVQLTDDLSYARTHYPDSQTTAYLNNLAAKVHQSIYRNRKEERGRFVHFWRFELPRLFYGAHRQLLYSAILFCLAVLIGAVSTAHDERFPRLIVGDAYVNMTLENIRNGDPMGIYKSQGQFDMFGQITFNNVMVSFWTFVMGIFFSFGTAYLLLRNGIMVGAFQYFFHTKGLLYTSALSIWIHGTLEISAIIIAGCAGLVMGNSLLFPGTYSRVESLKHGAVKGLKIIIGLVPIFIVAGFLESYVTRLTAWPDWAKLLIIGSSAAFIIWYFIIYPILLNRHADPSGQD
jgi:uncharacterized membrane protein SpoIIM required for sporulation